MKKPKILILDEATSALDLIAEKKIQKAIKNIIKVGGITVIICAHRLSTVKIADCIFMWQDGKIVEKGNHFELIKKNGKYKELI